MNRYKIEHNGQIYTVEAASPDEAISFVQSQGQQAAPKPIAEGDWQGLAGRVEAAATKPVDAGQGPVTADQMAKNRMDEAKRQGELYGKSRLAGETAKAAFENSLLLGLPRLAESYLPSWAGGQSALPGAEAHEFVKAADKGRQQANPGSALAGQLGGGLAQAMVLPAGAIAGGSTGGRLIGGGLVGAGVGAAEGMITSRGDAAETTKGALIGGALGTAGAGVAEGIGRGIKALRSTPEERASNMLYKAARQDKLTPDVLGQRLDDLGPQAVLADVMGERGIALARGANTASPEARAALSYLAERQQGQNARVVQALEEATGFGGKSADQIKAADRAARQPAINAAYDAARGNGADLPSETLRLLRQSPAFNEAYDAAGKSVANRSAAEAVLKGGQPGQAAANSEFARLNAVKIQFDDMAEAARRSGNMGAAEEAGTMAKAVRQVIDEMVPEASAARGLAREGFQFGEAVDLGAGLAKGRITADDLAAAAKAAPEVQPGLAQGYAAQIAENLNNRRSTPGALNALDTEFSGEAAKAALRERAEGVLKQVQREREFARTASILGNSKTADKMMDIKALAQEGSILGGLTGADYLYGTGTGAGGIAAALARRGGKAISQNMADRRLQEVAPLIAQALVARQLPPQAAGVGQKFIGASVDPRLPIIAALMATSAAQGGSQ